ncbi:MAG TPA: hypothetical protein VLE49_21545, partial [Anaerolineales bacterium]|nr:hypothetical protein [Anaerolineales bacterium]
MKHLIYSSPFKKALQIALSLVLGVTLLGSSAAYASGLCVHPTGAGHCFTSIQAAVDAANDGDQIIIRPGKYVEQVTIVGKNLTLIGRRGAIVQAPEVMEDTLSPVAGYEARPIILVAEAAVTVRDLVIDGADSAASNPFIFGIAFINADGVIRSNVVKNIGFGTPTLPEDGSYQGEGIVVVNFGATPRTVTIAENYVADYNASGITIFAQGMPEDPTLGSLTVNVVNNTVIGSGPNDVLSQWGVFFGGYEGAQMAGSLKGNRIRDLITIDQYPAPGIGITTKDMTGVEISGNVIENVDMGLNVSGMGTQVLQNRFKRVSN